MNVDYLIVGFGLAGLNFCELLSRNEKSFVVFDDSSQLSSIVAGGLYNPVILKRFTPVWKSMEQLELAKEVYSSFEKKLNKKFDYELPIKRVFYSIEEQNNWSVATDKKGLEPFLSNRFIKNENKFVNAPYGLGEVLRTGRIDIALLISEFKNSIVKDKLHQETFDYHKLIIEGDGIKYHDITAKHIIFSEGFGLRHNHFFNTLPLKGTKGELLTIYAPDLKIDYVLKSNVFLIPLENHHYRVGATYEWTDKTNKPTENGKQELLSKLKELIKCPFEVIGHHAGIRPTVIDRRPLVGTHIEYKNLHVLNGLGTRGVMIAPYVARALFETIENNQPLDREIDIKRFLV